MERTRNELSDELLLQLFNNQSESENAKDAKENLYLLFEGSMNKFVKKVASPDELEDLLQEGSLCLLTIFNDIEKNGIKNIPYDLEKFVGQELGNHLKTVMYQSRLEDAASEEREINKKDCSYNDLQIEDIITNQSLLFALSKLNHYEIKVFLKLYAGMSVEAIANYMELDVEIIEEIITSMRAKLKRDFYSEYIGDAKTID